MLEYEPFNSKMKPETMLNMMNLEIDYMLMELHDALKEGDEMKIRTIKMRLEKLCNCREEIQAMIKRFAKEKEQTY